jgi:hypothetical protein
MAEVKDFTMLANGKVMVKGVEMTIEELAGLASKHIKGEEDMIKKTANTEYSRSKREHKLAEYARIVENDPKLLQQVTAFDEPFENFIERATTLVKQGKGQRT